MLLKYLLGFPGDASGKVAAPPASVGNIRDEGLIPGLETSPGEGNGNPLKYSRPENPIGREAMRVTVNRVTKSQTRLK